MGGLKLGLNGMLRIKMGVPYLLHQKLANCLCETLNRTTICGGRGAYVALAATALAVVPSNDRRCLVASARSERQRAVVARKGEATMWCRSSAEEATRIPPEPLRIGRRQRRVSRDASWIARDGRRWIWSPATDMVGGA
ncbi:hypothetical protein U1Q18_016334 [Sarracenia purpurea var. burkii]